MSVSGTVGGVHHLASVVPDAEKAALLQETALGWQRLSDETYTKAKAELLGSVLGATGTTRFRTVMLQSTSERPGARVEFIDLDTHGGPGHVVLPGLHVASYRVRDAPESWAELLRAGAEPVRTLVDFEVAGWPMRVGTVRVEGNCLLEIIEFR